MTTLKSWIKAKNLTFIKKQLDERFRREGNYSTNGAETIFEYETDDYFNPTFSLATSFISNDKLYHLYKDSISTKIGTIENKKLVPFYEFKSEIRPFQWNYVRNPIQNNNFQSVQFRTDKDSVYGIIEIYKNDFNVTYFNNIYKEPVFGEKELNKWLENTFNNYYSNFSELTLKQIDKAEQQINATDITQKHKISTFRLDGKNVETPRIYRKTESDSLKLITMYYYEPEFKRIELINWEWGINRSNQIDRKVFLHLSQEEKAKILYEPKFNWIYKFLTAKFGQPTTTKKDDFTITQIWLEEDKEILLKLSTRDTELVLQRK